MSRRAPRSSTTRSSRRINAGSSCSARDRRDSSARDEAFPRPEWVSGRVSMYRAMVASLSERRESMSTSLAAVMAVAADRPGAAPATLAGVGSRVSVSRCCTCASSRRRGTSRAAAAASASTLDRAARSSAAPRSASRPVDSLGSGAARVCWEAGGALAAEDSSARRADCHPAIMSHGNGACGSSRGQRALHCQQNWAPHWQAASTTSGAAGEAACRRSSASVQWMARPHPVGHACQHEASVRKVDTILDSYRSRRSSDRSRSMVLSGTGTYRTSPGVGEAEPSACGRQSGTAPSSTRSRRWLRSRASDSVVASSHSPARLESSSTSTSASASVATRPPVLPPGWAAWGGANAGPKKSASIPGLSSSALTTSP
mmetsp:Transcript_23227/g.75222  ORF Transcript_23227/g.75222 Transcript_23227/m.75222 type:complete len:373 (-) Transcript_23227:292-1410(-)